MWQERGNVWELRPAGRGRDEMKCEGSDRILGGSMRMGRLPRSISLSCEHTRICRSPDPLPTPMCDLGGSGALLFSQPAHVSCHVSQPQLC